MDLDTYKRIEDKVKKAFGFEWVLNLGELEKALDAECMDTERE